MHFKKKPVTVEAVEWAKPGDSPHVEDFHPASYAEANRCKHCRQPMRAHGWIETLESGHIVCPGDYIVTGVAGEHYPVKPEIFAQSYEPEDLPAA